MASFGSFQCEKLGVYCTRKWQKKISIRDALAPSYIIQHRNPKNFPINACIDQVTHASSNSTRLHQLTPTTTKVQLSTAYNSSSHHTATVDLLWHQLTPTTTTVRLSTAYNNSQLHIATVDLLWHQLTTTNTTVRLSTAYNNSQLHTATVDILLQLVTSQCNMKQHMSSYNTSHLQVESKNNRQEH